MRVAGPPGNRRRYQGDGGLDVPVRTHDPGPSQVDLREDIRAQSQGSAVICARHLSGGTRKASPVRLAPQGSADAPSPPVAHGLSRAQLLLCGGSGGRAALVLCFVERNLAVDLLGLLAVIRNGRFY